MGALLALLRTNAGFTQRGLADELCVSEETVASIEQGRRALLPDTAEQIDRVLGTGGVLAVVVGHMPGQDKFPVWAEAYMQLEQEAIALSSYENAVVPGLLQTAAYARAVFRCSVPAINEAEVERRLETRLKRQVILHREVPLTATFVISEAVVIARIGGQEVMHEQLSHLRACADLPGVSIQVLPLDCEFHAGISGPFVLLETPDYRTHAYTEAQLTSRFLTSPDEISRLTHKFGMLRMQALSADETRKMLDRLLGER
ncbi:Scr1 family TA system antitoxin-like transcriptional regulator [Streptomyces sp. NPDC052396]|uniref:helix-turn-helix domain-containing protein n=1 Tax=Streptomyces sp. NPDC052396 TaxID=3365689 RepID=UPI0037CEC4F8